MCTTLHSNDRVALIRIAAYQSHPVERNFEQVATTLHSKD